MAILINPVQPPFLMPAPDAIEHAANLGDNNYRQCTLVAHDGRQAAFDIFPDGETDQGLRVTIQRGTGRLGFPSNGYAVSFATGAADVAVDDTDRTIVITIPDGSALSVFKTNIDAEAALDSAYFGGETGTSTIATTGDVPDTVSAGATHDRSALIRFSVTHNVFVHTGTSAPSNDSRAGYVIGGSGSPPALIVVPPGERLWLKREGGNDARGSAEMWVIEGGG